MARGAEWQGVLDVAVVVLGGLLGVQELLRAARGCAAGCPDTVP